MVSYKTKCMVSMRFSRKSVIIFLLIPIFNNIHSFSSEVSLRHYSQLEVTRIHFATEKYHSFKIPRGSSFSICSFSLGSLSCHWENTSSVSCFFSFVTVCEYGGWTPEKEEEYLATGLPLYEFPFLHIFGALILNQDSIYNNLAIAAYFHPVHLLMGYPERI